MPEAPRYCIDWMNDGIYNRFKAEMLTVASELQALIHTVSEVSVLDSINNVFSNQFGVTWITPGRAILLFSGFFFLTFFKQIPIYFSCLGKCYKCCFAAKLQKCFVNYQTSPDFPSAQGWKDNGWICVFGWTVTLSVFSSCHHLVLSGVFAIKLHWWFLIACRCDCVWLKNLPGGVSPNTKHAGIGISSPAEPSRPRLNMAWTLCK